MRQTVDLTFAQAQPLGRKHIADNLTVATYTPEALRPKRHIIRDGLQTLLYPCRKFQNPDLETGELRVISEFSINACGRIVRGEKVAVYQNGEVIGTSGSTKCGNAWSCPFCSAKIMRMRGDQISEIFEKHHATGGSAVMVTWTASNSIDKKLAETVNHFKDAYRFARKGRPYRNLTKNILAGEITAFEITYNDRNGWHPHFHSVLFIKKCVEINDMFIETLADSLFLIWESASNKHGLKTLKYFKGRRVGIDVRRAWDASEYLTKFNKERDWSLSAEMTAGRLKGSKGGSVTPLTIMELAIVHGRSSKYFDLTLEFLRATKGKAIISLKGAKKLLAELDIPLTFDDYADANKPGEGVILGYLDKETYYSHMKHGGMGRVLEMARIGNFHAVKIQPQEF